MRGLLSTIEQDETPAHTSRLAQSWCEENLLDFLKKTEWPPSSPDCNPMNFSTWGILGAKVDKVLYPNVEAVKSVILKEWDMLTEDTVRAAMAQVGRRLHAVHNNGDGHIEHI